MMSQVHLLDMTVYGRQEAWEDSPDGWPQQPMYSWWRVGDVPIPALARLRAVGLEPPTQERTAHHVH